MFLSVPKKLVHLSHKIPGSKRDARKYRKCPPLWRNHDIPTLYVLTRGNQNDGCTWNNSSHLSRKTFLVCLVRGGSGDSWLLWILFNKVDTWVPPSECKYNLTLPLTICEVCLVMSACDPCYEGWGWPCHDTETPAIVTGIRCHKVISDAHDVVLMLPG